MSRLWEDRSWVIMFYWFLLSLGMINTVQSKRAQFPKDVLLHTSFNEWEKWKTDFSSCDPDSNPNTSPINIIPSKAIKDSSLEPIIVHAGLPPEGCLSISTIHKDDNLEMEVVNIFPEDICRKEMTFISGAGEGAEDLRYFKKAFIFFSGSDVSPPQSLHQFDGKSFQMEIAMEFGKINGSDVTEIHLMVEVLPESEVPTNPVFKPIEDALHQLKLEIADEAAGQTETGKKRLELKEKCETAEERYFKTYAEVEDREKNGTTLTAQLRKLRKLIHSIKNVTNAILEDKIRKTSNMSGKTPEEEAYNSAEEECAAIRDKQNELLELTNENMNATQPPELIRDLTKTNSEVVDCAKKLTKLKTALIDTRVEIFLLREALKALKKLLAIHKVGFPGESSTDREILFESPDAVYDERDKIIELMKQLNETEKRYRKTCGAYAYYKAVSRYVHVPIEDPLQISWLFPHNSGYFYYHGSSPIPRCERTDQSIVLDTPINITTEQLKSFLGLPSLAEWKTGNGSMDGTLDKMIPVLHSRSSDEVRHVKKGLVFLKDEGFHALHAEEIGSEPGTEPGERKFKPGRGLIEGNAGATSGSARIIWKDLKKKMAALLMTCFVWISM